MSNTTASTPIERVRELISNAEVAEKEALAKMEEVEVNLDAIKELISELNDELIQLNKAKQAYEDMDTDRVDGIINEIYTTSVRL